MTSKDQSASERLARAYADNLHTMNCHQLVWQRAHADFKAGYDAAVKEINMQSNSGLLAENKLLKEQIAFQKQALDDVRKMRGE